MRLRDPHRGAVVVLVALGVLSAGCSSGENDSGFRPGAPTPPGAQRSAPASASEPTTPHSTGPSSPALTGAGSEPATSSSSVTTTTSTTSTTIDPAAVPRAFPVDPAVDSSFTPEAHASYRAADIFASSGCGTGLRSPVRGHVDEVVSNAWDAAVDDPATRGGNAISIIGDDGVRYYLAHFRTVDGAIVSGARVEAGQYLGEMGDTGRAGACHVHVGLSLPCRGTPGEWWVRRGVIWPDKYLTDWRDGGNLSPLPELQAWFAEHPDACRSVDDTPYPVG